MTKNAQELTAAATMISTLSYTDFLLIGGLTVLAYYIFRARRTSQASSSAQVVNLKTLKVLPSVTDENGPNKESPQEKSLLEKMKSTGKTLVIFFGSQTGTAEEFARRLAKNARLYGIKAIVVDPEEVDTSELTSLVEIPNCVAVFVIATYGEGDPTDNAQQFVDYLRQDDVDLGGIKYAVFGLGNKTYEHYNEVGKFMDKRLEEINASRLMPLGLGDDDGNIEEDFVTWMDKFWPAICEYQGVSNMEQDISMRQYQLQTHDNLPPEKVFKGDITRLNSYIKQRPPFDAKKSIFGAHNRQ
jgi:NADPH-ferrihemoprotein reductase